MTAKFSTVEQKNIEALVELIRSNKHGELCTVKTTKKDVLIPQGSMLSVNCRAKIGPYAGSPV